MRFVERGSVTIGVETKYWGKVMTSRCTNGDWNV